VVVDKLCDSLPLYRQARRIQRAGMPICRNTLCDLFHRTGEQLAPLHRRMLQLVRKDDHVNADETPIGVLAPGKIRRAYIWTFTGGPIVTYVYSPSRSGKTPVDVLGTSQGYLQVDGYSGYNKVCVPDGRTRVGCLAHLRRYFFRALSKAPTEAQWVLDKIADL
jgi:transposase